MGVLGLGALVVAGRRADRVDPAEEALGGRRTSARLSSASQRQAATPWSRRSQPTRRRRPSGAAHPADRDGGARRHAGRRSDGQLDKAAALGARYALGGECARQRRRDQPEHPPRRCRYPRHPLAGDDDGRAAERESLPVQAAARPALSGMSDRRAAGHAARGCLRARPRHPRVREFSGFDPRSSLRGVTWSASHQSPPPCGIHDRFVVDLSSRRCSRRKAGHARGGRAALQRIGARSGHQVRCARYLALPTSPAIVPWRPRRALNAALGGSTQAVEPFGHGTSRPIRAALLSLGEDTPRPPGWAARTQPPIP